ncbi:ABC transporter ATP-binding protein [Iamia sp.]|uniref:ABC transporter ATP-binding protein n=1 Tax=Iamia sp. TaxID=2722710 RepID=UPI002D11D795|nr:ABC transporter ATP-binding protein [Iamia sp.]HXH58325.1 ABC transporter ATP-binding protein [Iamia sp.]
MLDGVRRRFAAVEALRGLSLRAEQGTITVLLGPNGAGKTTAIRVITGALGVHDGHVRVFGLDPDVPRDGESVRRRCGIVSAKPALYDRLSGLDNLRYAAELYGLGWSDEARDRVVDAATRFGIQGSLDVAVGGYSTGMKTRLALARSVLHEPDLLLFDEPTSGLDPESSHAVLAMIKEMAAGGTTVIMCTHLLLEAEGLAEQVVMMEAGLHIASGRPDELIRRYWPDDSVRLAEPRRPRHAPRGAGGRGGRGRDRRGRRPARRPAPRARRRARPDDPGRPSHAGRGPRPLPRGALLRGPGAAPRRHPVLRGHRLAHSPAAAREIYLGKVIASIIPGYLTTFVGFGAYSLIVNLLVGPEVGGWFFPTQQWWIMVLWVLPPVPGHHVVDRAAALGPGAVDGCGPTGVGARHPPAHRHRLRPGHRLALRGRQPGMGHRRGGVADRPRLAQPGHAQDPALAPARRRRWHLIPPKLRT